MTKRFSSVRQTLMATFAGLAVAVVAALPASTRADAAVPELGIWLDDTGQGAVEIYVCADRNDRLCGRVVWLKDPLNAQGEPKHDRYNPNASMQGRPICGLPVLGNLERTEEGFDGGWIYDPKVGKSYNAAITASRDRLTVTGYLGMKFMGKSFVWTRAPADLLRCNATAAPAQAPAPIKGAAPPAAAGAPKAAAAAPQAKPAAAPPAAKKPATGSPAPASGSAAEARAGSP